MLEKILEKIKNNKLYYFSKILVTTIFSVVLFLDNILVFEKTIFARVGQIYFANVKISNILVFIGSWIITYVIMTLLEKLVDFVDKRFHVERKTSKKSILVFFLFLVILLICWLPYILSYFPGGIYADTINTLQQALGRMKITNHHPVLYTLIFKVFVKIGMKIQSLQLGIELFTIFQIVLMAGVISCFLYWLYKRNVSTKIIVLATMFFALCRLIPLYAVSLWKDVPFCLALFGYIIFIAETVYKNGKNLEKLLPSISYSVLLLLVSFLRNNGRYITLAMTICLLIVYRKNIIKGLKKFTSMAVISILIVFIVQGPIYDKYNMNTSFVESIGIPLQQICFVVSTDGNMTEEQRKFVNDMCEIEIIKQKYSPCVVDTIKWADGFHGNFIEDNKEEFMKKWLEIGLQNPKSYIAAYLFNTLGFWDVNQATIDAYINPRMWGNIEDVEQKDYIEEITGHSIREVLEPEKPISSAIYLFVLLFSATLTIYKKRYKNLLIYLPAFFTWGTIMIAAPLAFSFRYVYILFLTLPLTIIVPFLKSEEEIQK